MVRALEKRTCRKCGKSYETRDQTACCSRVCARALSVVPAKERFWAKVQKDEGGCWTWKGAVDGCGYGCFMVRTNVREKAHRYSYLMANGNLPKSEICHSCDNPACVRPDHLFAASHHENMKDAQRKKRMARLGGEANGANKYPSELIIRVHELAPAMSQDKIAEVTGISQTHISRILRGENWRCLQPPSR